MIGGEQLFGVVIANEMRKFTFRQWNVTAIFRVICFFNNSNLLSNKHLKGQIVAYPNIYSAEVFFLSNY